MPGKAFLMQLPKKGLAISNYDRMLAITVLKLKEQADQRNVRP